MVEYFYTDTIPYRLYLTKDGKIIASGSSAPISNEKIIPKNQQPVTSLIPSFYSTVEDVENTWGKPAQIETLDNGIQKRLYKYAGTMDVGYRFFLVKDGKVIGDGTTR